MTTRGAAIQGALAALGLLAAYTTWQRAPDRPAGEVTVLDASKSELQSVRFEDGKSWVEIDRRKGDDGPEAWLEVSARPAEKAPERELRGNQGAMRLLDKFTPLMAERGIGKVPPAKLKEFGLDASKKRLIVAARGEKVTFDVGSSPYGVSAPYVKDERDGKVYVLGGSILSDLRAASVRLVDRTLHDFKTDGFDALTVTVGSKSRELTQTGADSPATERLVGKKSGKPDTMAKNWHDKIWRMFVIDPLGKGELPPGGAPQVALKISYQLHGKEVGFIELGQVTPPPKPTNVSSAAPPPPPQPEIYARTEHTAGWVKLPGIAGDLIKEAHKVVDGE